MWLLLAATLGSSPAEASCQYLVRRANASSSSTLARNFTSLAKCSQQEAEASFNGLLPRAKSVDTLVDLSMAAIETEVARVLAGFGAGSGHVFNLGHGLQPGMDPEHVGACVAAVHALSPAYHAGASDPGRSAAP